jgi:hypothetical protein
MELSKVQSQHIDGVLRFKNERNEDLFNVGATTGIPISSQYQKVTNLTAAATLAASDCGYVITCSTDAVVITLPSATGTGYNYIIMNTASDGGALINVKGAVPIIGGSGAGSASDGLVVATNTKATHKIGDAIGVTLGWVTTNAWIVTELVGTWARATTT